MKIKSYKDLLVWQKSMNLAKSLYEIVQKLPKEEKYALSDQLRRASVSIPSNIAEGFGRETYGSMPISCSFRWVRPMNLRHS